MGPFKFQIYVEFAIIYLNISIILELLFESLPYVEEGEKFGDKRGLSRRIKSTLSRSEVKP